ncbi:protein kinase [Sphingosinicella sp. LHD-64]|uniref:protein kinase domain-containing protein n=1 Tax=Sphingosinicella sp. LHD-64 TaxID=3072139 RepID=UPI00280F1911|nr:protein kinase [Sphingosinicella sp. LHD-64]MDQ8755310.1 protein kinase [Sphingosinicella sp. LHD-64]
MRRVGRYEIENRIGEGAMADVYRAYDPEIGRRIAIKVLKPELRDNAEVAERFLREARAAGALAHPHIVTIHDVGEADGFPYIAMELLDGLPLDQHIRLHGALPLEAVLATGAQLARALHYAHESGIVHRDIKPSNIILCDGGRTAKILDFGIARIGEPDPLRAELNALRTQVGQVLGTPRYMSPEQALGLAIDHRSDLFSLGVVLYEMASGRMAFDGASLATLAIQITQQQPQPLGTVLPGCPRGLQYIVGKMLAKSAAKRFSSGAEVAEALARERAAMDGARQGRGLPLRWRVGLVIGATMGLALLISMIAVLDRQYRSMSHMAVTSGTTITTFVANNVGLRAAENAGLPSGQQDWAPVQAFVDVAARDPAVRHITVIDATGIVRGSSNPAKVGRRDTPTDRETLVSDGADERVSQTAGNDFRFRRTIRYAGQPFGTVELVMSGAELAQATAHATWLMGGLALVLMLVVALVSHMAAGAITRPLRQLRSALEAAAEGNFQFRISHRRCDEFGRMFDAYNHLADILDEAPSAPPPAVDATQIAPAPSGRYRRVA